jgi:hypothetical protein
MIQTDYQTQFDQWIQKHHNSTDETMKILSDADQFKRCLDTYIEQEGLRFTHGDLMMLNSVSDINHINPGIILDSKRTLADKIMHIYWAAEHITFTACDLVQNILRRWLQMAKLEQVKDTSPDVIQPILEDMISEQFPEQVDLTYLPVTHSIAEALTNLSERRKKEEYANKQGNEVEPVLHQKYRLNVYEERFPSIVRLMHKHLSGHSCADDIISPDAYPSLNLYPRELRPLNTLLEAAVNTPSFDRYLGLGLTFDQYTAAEFSENMELIHEFLNSEHLNKGQKHLIAERILKVVNTHSESGRRVFQELFKPDGYLITQRPKYFLKEYAHAISLDYLVALIEHNKDTVDILNGFSDKAKTITALNWMKLDLFPIFIRIFRHISEEAAQNAKDEDVNAFDKAMVRTVAAFIRKTKLDALMESQYLPSAPNSIQEFSVNPVTLITPAINSSKPFLKKSALDDLMTEHNGYTLYEDICTINDLATKVAPHVRRKSDIKELMLINNRLERVTGHIVKRIEREAGVDKKTAVDEHAFDNVL